MSGKELPGSLAIRHCSTVDAQVRFTVLFWLACEDEVTSDGSRQLADLENTMRSAVMNRDGSCRTALGASCPRSCTRCKLSAPPW